MEPTDVNSESGNGVELATWSSDAFRQEYLDSSAITTSRQEVTPTLSSADDIVVVIGDPYPLLQPAWAFNSRNIEQPRQKLISEFQQATPDRNRQSEFMQAMSAFEKRAKEQRLDEKEVEYASKEMALSFPTFSHPLAQVVK